jgi:hypothetical protein
MRNKNGNRSSKRRNNNNSNRNGSTTARNQTKYHRQNVGFEASFGLSPSAGIVINVAPGNYSSPGSIPTSAFSKDFFARFSPAWKSWRMLGWKGTVVATSRPDAQSDNAGMLGVAPFNLSKQATTSSPVLPAPASLQQLCELPNVKMLSADSANSKNRAVFSYFQGRRDINSLPFQEIDNNPLPTLYTTGIQVFNDNGPIEEGVFVRFYGYMVIEFKDPAYYTANLIPAKVVDEDDYAMPSPEVVKTTKRLQRTLLD